MAYFTEDIDDDDDFFEGDFDDDFDEEDYNDYFFEENYDELEDIHENQNYYDNDSDFEIDF